VAEEAGLLERLGRVVQGVLVLLAIVIVVGVIVAAAPAGDQAAAALDQLAGERQRAPAERLGDPLGVRGQAAPSLTSTSPASST
jgi:hypothetical protein